MNNNIVQSENYATIYSNYMMISHLCFSNTYLLTIPDLEGEGYRVTDYTYYKFKEIDV